MEKILKNLLDKTINKLYILLFLLVVNIVNLEGSRGKCWAITDNLPVLYIFNMEDGNLSEPEVIDIKRSNKGEGLAYRVSTNELYMWGDGKTYILNADTGEDVRSFNTPYANELEGAAFYIDPNTLKEELWITREDLDDGNPPKQHDRYLEQIDPDSGEVLSSVKLTGGFMQEGVRQGKDTGGLAIDPKTKEFWITDDSGDRGFYRVDPESGVIGDGVFIKPDRKALDLEGFAFSADGNFYSESDNSNIKEKIIWKLDKESGEYTQVTKPFGGDGGDIEAIECNGGVNTILYTPEVEFTKTVNGKDANSLEDALIIEVNSSIYWEYYIKNIGNERLVDIKLVDYPEGDISCPKSQLDINESMVCRLDGIAKEREYQNSAVVLAKGELSGKGVEVKDISIYKSFKSFCIGNRIWLDINGNGVQDSNEENFKEPVIVELIGEDGKEVFDSNRDLITPIKTSNGEYLFCKVKEGIYRVKFTAPNNFIFSPQNIGNYKLDSDVNRDSNLTKEIYLQDNNMSIDAGLIPLNCIGNRVWLDENKNGIQDDEEVGVAGVKITLNEENLTTFSDKDGYYRFCKLKSGKYSITVDKTSLNEDFRFTLQDIGDDRKDSDINPDSGLSNYIDLQGDDNLTLDIGVYKLDKYCLGEYIVWEDLDRDGIQDKGEPRVDGVVIYLLDKNDNLIQKSVTSNGGIYKFCNLLAGEYKIRVDLSTLPKKYNITRKDAGSEELDSDIDPLTKESSLIIVGSQASIDSNQTIIDLDLGIYKLISKIEIEKFTKDSKGNFQDADTLDGEDVPKLTLGERVVWKYIVKNSGDNLLKDIKVVDNMEGEIKCPKESLKANEEMECIKEGKVKYISYTNIATATSKNEDGEIIEDSDSSSYLAESIEKLSATSIELNETICIGDFIWLDSNLNGIQDSNELGVVGAEVQLLDISNNLLSRSKTDNSGHYKFCNLERNSDYILKLITPKSYAITIKDSGDDSNDSDANMDGEIYIENLTDTNNSFDIGIFCKCKDKNDRDLNSKIEEDRASFSSIIAIIFYIILIYLV